MLFYSDLWLQKENETGTTSSGRRSSHHTPFISALCEYETLMKNVNANVRSFFKILIKIQIILVKS